MITVPAMRLHQFGVYFYQAILGVRDVQKLVRFEVLSYGEAGRTHGKRPVKAGRAGKVNWDVLENKIAHSADAYQRPVIQRKIAELMDYYLQCAEAQNLPAIPGAVLLVCDQRLDFVAISSHRILGVLQLPPEEGSLRALDGQHRLLALHQLAEEHPAEDVQVPAIIFDRLAADQVVELFVTINAKHTKLNPSHLISLSGRRLYPDPVAGRQPRHRALTQRGQRLAAARRDQAVRRRPRPRRAGAARRGAEGRVQRARRLRRQAGRRLPRARHRASSRTTSSRSPRSSPRRGPASATASRRRRRCAPSCASSPTCLSAIRKFGDDPFEAAAIHNVIEQWGDYIGDARFETDGEWRLKLAGGTRGTVDVLARELRSALKTP